MRIFGSEWRVFGWFKKLADAEGFNTLILREGRVKTAVHHFGGGRGTCCGLKLAKQ
jgi:hypothetical protein